MNVAAILLPLALLSAAPLVAAEPIAVPAFRSLELRGGGTVVVRSARRGGEGQRLREASSLPAAVPGRDQL